MVHIRKQTRHGGGGVKVWTCCSFLVKISKNINLSLANKTQTCYQPCCDTGESSSEKFNITKFGDTFFFSSELHATTLCCSLVVAQHHFAK